MPELPRRFFLASFGAAGALTQTAPAVAAETPPPHDPATWFALSADQVKFVESLVSLLIPADELSPSGRDLGLAVYIDRQLAGAWGAGSREYRAGPFLQGAPELGEQSPLLPRDAVKIGIAAAQTGILSQFGTPLDQLPAAKQIAAVTWLEHQQPAFFNQILALTQEGLFADPIYGGNKNKQGWAIVGYPGLPALYRKDIARYRNRKYDKPARSIEDFS